MRVSPSEYAGTNKARLHRGRSVMTSTRSSKSLEAKGVTFEHYDDLPDSRREDDVHSRALHGGVVLVADGKILDRPRRTI